MWTFSLFMFVLLLLMGIILGLTPYYSRISAPFSVSLPPRFLKDEHVEQLKKRHLFWHVIWAFFLGVPFFFFPLIEDQGQFDLWTSLYATGAILGFVVFSTALFLRYRRELREWKKMTIPEGEKGKEHKITVDTRYREELRAHSEWSIFLWQLLIIVVTAGAAILFYDRIPERFPVHWNSSFEVDRYADKSWRSVLSLPLLQLIMAPVLTFSYYSFIQSKQKLSPKNPTVSSLKSRLFRRAWSNFFLLMAVVTQLLLSFLTFFSLFFGEGPMWIFLMVIFLYLGIVLGYTISLSLKYGQAGERLQLNEEEELSEAYYEDPEDEGKWILGMFYYNPDDPSIFVEKRFGIGSTFNMARWQAWAFVVGILAVPILLALLLTMTLH